MKKQASKRASKMSNYLPKSIFSF